MKMQCGWGSNFRKLFGITTLNVITAYTFHSLKRGSLLGAWLAAWMLGVAMATVRLVLALWTAVDDSKEDDEFDWTMTIVGCVIYINFAGMSDERPLLRKFE